MGLQGGPGGTWLPTDGGAGAQESSLVHPLPGSSTVPLAPARIPDGRPRAQGCSPGLPALALVSAVLDMVQQGPRPQAPRRAVWVRVEGEVEGPGQSVPVGALLLTAGQLPAHDAKRLPLPRQAGRRASQPVPAVCKQPGRGLPGLQGTLASIHWPPEAGSARPSGAARNQGPPVHSRSLHCHQSQAGYWR